MVAIILWNLTPLNVFVDWKRSKFVTFKTFGKNKMIYSHTNTFRNIWRILFYFCKTYLVSDNLSKSNKIEGVVIFHTKKNVLNSIEKCFLSFVVKVHSMFEFSIGGTLLLFCISHFLYDTLFCKELIIKGKTVSP